MSDTAAKIAALRASFIKSELEAPGTHARVPLGYDEVDACLHGGLRRGALHEIFAEGGHEAAATGFAAALSFRVAAEKRVLWIRQDFSAIECGELAIGTRLPSERALAEQLKISRTTVMSAYRELEARGLIHSHVGRGTFVCASAMRMPESLGRQWCLEIQSAVNACSPSNSSVMLLRIRSSSSPMSARTISQPMSCAPAARKF